jgi:hypothetical protein
MMMPEQQLPSISNANKRKIQDNYEGDNSDVLKIYDLTLDQGQSHSQWEGVDSEIRGTMLKKNITNLQ